MNKQQKIKRLRRVRDRFKKLADLYSSIKIIWHDLALNLEKDELENRGLFYYLAEEAGQKEEKYINLYKHIKYILSTI